MKTNKVLKAKIHLTNHECCKKTLIALRKNLNEFYCFYLYFAIVAFHLMGLIHSGGFPLAEFNTKALVYQDLNLYLDYHLKNWKL